MVPSFRFSLRENMRTYPRSGFIPGEHPIVPVSIRYKSLRSWDSAVAPGLRAPLLPGRGQNPARLKKSKKRVRLAPKQSQKWVKHGKKETMTMTKIPLRKPSGTYGHGPLKICFWKGKDDDHDQDFLKKDLLHLWSWSSDKSSSILKWVSGVKKQETFDSQNLMFDSFLTLFGGSAGTPRTLPGDVAGEAREGFDSARPRGSQHKGWKARARLWAGTPRVSNRKTMCMCEIGMAAALGSHPYCEFCWEHPKNPHSATSQWACSKKLVVRRRRIWFELVS